jgi:hypothetical protein
VGKGVTEGIAVATMGVNEGVNVALAVHVGVSDGVREAVNVAEGVSVEGWNGVKVADAVEVIVGVNVCEGVKLAVAVNMVAVGLSVGVAEMDRVDVGVEVAPVGEGASAMAINPMQ